ncbi:four helix bundle protein [Dyadobacter sp. LJ53]|uniref:four helix bundle protein n=1 Tax=Dyadobacter chenwenxiniae TaxID=2906456 RepID=UPI001F2C960D|nr:four helix bundle protein [Dyadobacter chenwenxiniae]MCF0053044.1 four helix bundle protein [Dyadobacter chenwenxiniae]
MQNYQELKVWQKAHQFVLEVYQITNAFPKTETFGLISQMRRASISVAANLAEGCGKKGALDIANFFQISLGSLHETEYYLLLSKDLQYISNETFELRDLEIKEIKAMLISLIKTVRNISNTK